MARATTSPLSSRVRAFRWQRLGVLAAVSLALGLTLVGYLFGWADHFATRLLTAFFVGFCLLTVTFLGILPFIGWAAAHWFGASWAARPAVGAARPAPTRRPAGARTTTI